MGLFSKNNDKPEHVFTEAQVNKLVDKAISQVTQANAVSDQGIRQRIRSIISGGYDFADTLHNIYLDFGYPCSLEFSNYWNMYRRFGIAKNVVELVPDAGWMSSPEVDGGEQFNREFDLIVDRLDLWNRMKGLDTRQRVGRYAGMFMRVKDGNKPDQPVEGSLSGVGSLVEMIPLYESQLEVITTDQDPMSKDFGQPTMYQFTGGVVGTRNEEAVNTFNIHPSRVVIAAEGADNGFIYGISVLEAIYNSLMDLRKIAGAGGEGFYKNAAQSIVFNLKDAASATTNKALLDKFTENYDEFAQNRARRAMWTPGMEATTLDSSLANPKEFFMNSLNDVAAGSKIPATILIGQQTGRLASNEDSRQFLAMVQSRRMNFMTQMLRDVIDWMIRFGVLPSSSYTVEWDDLLARSDEEKLNNAEKMAKINRDQFGSGGGEVFNEDEIREAAGFEAEPEEDAGSEELSEQDELGSQDLGEEVTGND